MSPIKMQLIDLIDCMPETEQTLLFEIAKHFVADDIATNDDLTAIEKARNEFTNGETVDFNNIEW